MRDRDPVRPAPWRWSPPQPDMPAPAKVAWPSSTDDDWLQDVRSYDGFVRLRRPD